MYILTAISQTAIYLHNNILPHTVMYNNFLINDQIYKDLIKLTFNSRIVYKAMLTHENQQSMIFKELHNTI